MSVKVELDRLAEALADFAFGYLITVGDDYRAHTVAVDAVLTEVLLCLLHVLAGLQQRLTGNAADVGAGAAHAVLAAVAAVVRIGLHVDARARAVHQTARAAVGALAARADLAALEALVDQVRDTGLTVTFRMQGTPTTIAADAQLAVYRIVQESLTNTMKHAAERSTASVTLTYGPTTLDVVTEDDGAGQPVPAGWQAGPRWCWWPGIPRRQRRERP